MISTEGEEDAIGLSMYKTAAYLAQNFALGAAACLVTKIALLTGRATITQFEYVLVDRYNSFSTLTHKFKYREVILDLFKKDKPDPPKLPLPDDSISFFEAIRSISESQWVNSTLATNIYGFQIQANLRKWRSGLTDAAIQKNSEKHDWLSIFPHP